MTVATAKTCTRFANILFATDFSPAAALAIPYVRKIAKHYQSKLVALYVRPPVVNPMTRPESWPTDIESAKAFDERHREEILGAFAGIPMDVVIEEGDVLSALNAVIQEHDTDLLVIGTRGRTGLKKLLLGSVAEEIFRTVACPVLTVGPHAASPLEAAGDFREILYATDLEPETQGAAAYAASLAEEFQAKLILLHVVLPSKVGETDYWLKIRDSSQELLRKLVPPSAEASCKPQYFVERGDPADQILLLAAVRQPDLIVLGTRPEGGVPGAATHLPGATAHKVVSRAACPVLTVRHP